MIETIDHPEAALARFLGPAAAAEWRAFLGHLEFHTGFGLFVLMLPAQAGAAQCERVIHQRLLAKGFGLSTLRFTDSEQLETLPSDLLQRSDLRKAGAVWVSLFEPTGLKPEVWREQCRRVFALLNQQRNPLAETLRVPLILVGEFWLQTDLRECAPDLWSVRVAVESLSPPAPFPGVDDGMAKRFDDLLTNSMVEPSMGAEEPDYALERFESLPVTAEYARQRVHLLVSAAEGFHACRKFELAVDCFERARRLLEEAAEKDDVGWRILYARTCQGLSLGLATLGRPEDALGPAQEAVECHRLLVQQSPNVFTPTLAGALNNLANFLSATGRRAEALAPSQEAVELNRALVARNPDAFTPNLAISLHNLASRLSALGRRADALGPAQEAADLRRVLARQNPDGFIPDLAMSLNNLANRLSELGREADALGPAQEAVGLRRVLARQNPNAFTQDLASSLNNLANRLSALGRWADALGPAQEAVELFRVLARQNPDAFTPSLAMSLNNLANRLSALGRRADALGPAQEAVELFRVLARKNSDAFIPSLAMSLNNLAASTIEVGRHVEALVPATEAVDLRRALAMQNPDAFTPDFVSSLGMMGRVQEANGRPEAALACFRDGVERLTPFFQRLPMAFAPLIQGLASDYLRVLATTGREPDFAGSEAFLVPVMEGLQALAAQKPSETSAEE